jgi:acetyltransferase
MRTLEVDAHDAPGDAWNETFVTRGDVTMAVRAVLPTDAPILVELFAHVSPADLRSRFLSGLLHVDAGRIRQMIDIDYRNTITFLAFADGRPIATAMFAADARRIGEVAISVRSDMKARGVGWTLLQHVMRFAKAHGVDRVESMESRASAATISLEQDAGFTVRQCEGDPADIIATRQL